jgi:hypothetical protein
MPATLFWHTQTFGDRFRRAGHSEIKAHYATVADAVAQAEHDQRLGRRPLRVEDEAGQIVWTAPAESKE